MLLRWGRRGPRSEDALRRENSGEVLREAAALPTSRGATAPLSRRFVCCPVDSGSDWLLRLIGGWASLSVGRRAVGGGGLGGCRHVLQRGIAGPFKRRPDLKLKVRPMRVR